VTRHTIRVAWYRFVATQARRRGGYLALIVLIGLVGGLAMGSIAAARRTQSSFPRYVASTNPSDLNGITSFVNPSPSPAGLGYNPALLAEITRLPHVKQVSTGFGLNIIPLGPRGTPESPAAYPASAGEVLGAGTSAANLDSPTVLQGRLPDPSRADEFVVSATSARIFGFHVGQLVPFGIYTNAQTNDQAFGTAAVAPYRRFEARMVGIVISSTSVVRDDTDGGNNENLLAFTPALTRPLLGCCVYFSAASVKVAGGHAEVTTVQREIAGVLPPGINPFQANGILAIETKAERAIKPESIALGVFGAIAALAALLIAAQIIGRQLRLGVVDLGTLRSLGADPAMTVGDGIIGIVGAVVIGSFLAVGVAICLSPLSPLGPVRPVDPTPGVSFDWTVLAVGFVVLMVALSAVGLAVGYRLAPHRIGSRRRRSVPPRSAVAGYAAGAGLPESAVTGIRFALEPGVGRNAVPVRSAILGSVLAMVVVITTVTFGASLNTLISRPALYGWNWTYELSSNQGGVIPGSQAARLLGRDHSVAAWSGVYFGTTRIDGQIDVPVLGESLGARVAPPLLSGHEVEASNQVVVGALTLAQLHKQVGELVTARLGGTNNATTRLRIVGTATMPTIGGGEGGQHLEMGTGIVMSTQQLPQTANSGYQLPGAAPGPNAILVRLKDGSSSAGFRSLQQIAGETSTPADYGVSLLSVQRPAEIVNYRSMGATPAILGAALATGVAGALCLTLIASVRRRQRDLALFKTLGFTRRQLAAAISWQSSISVALGTAVGLPLGIIAGRSLWILFAHEIDVIPYPTVPATTVALIAIGALLLANLVAALPAGIASRTPTAVLLHSE
jgi:hypothetical protein